MAVRRIGIIGLGTMGSNLAMNFLDNDCAVSVWNLEPDLTRRFQQVRTDPHLTCAWSFRELVEDLEQPRTILMMIQAGAPVDEILDQLLPLLDPGDVVIDGGNTHFADTSRRCQNAAAQDIHFVGLGISGGAEGARHGPSMMFGGSDHAWNLLRPLLETVAAAGPMGPCVDRLGPEGAGHFVKMVHNGIEYADMQMIAEIWDMVRHQVQPEDLPDLFAALNDSPLESFLIELTAGVLRRKDEISGAHLVNRVLDVAEQKGTGRWSVETALDLAVPIPSIAAAVSARTLSARKNERSTLAKIYPARGNISMIEPDVLIRAARATRLCVFAQGMQLIQAANQAFEWQISAAGVARVWTAGCIIRSSLLTDIVQAYTDRPELVNLIASPHFTATLTQCSPALRSLCASAMKDGIPVPVFSSTLTWFDSVRCDHLPQSLIQAQRDAFGAHTYRRTDDPDGPAIHTDWL